MKNFMKILCYCLLSYGLLTTNTLAQTPFSCPSPDMTARPHPNSIEKFIPDLSWDGNPNLLNSLATDPVVLRCNFVVVHQSSSQANNFENNATHLSFLLDEVAPMINNFFEHVTLPSDPATCACEDNPFVDDDCHIEHTGIRFEFTGVHFVQNSALYGEVEQINSQGGYAALSVNLANTINIFLSGSDSTTALGGRIANRFDDCSPALYMTMANTYRTYTQNPSTSAYAIAQNIVHELGHIFGLEHLYSLNGQSSSAISDLEDIVGNGDTDCPPYSIASTIHPQNWNCDPLAFDHFQQDPNSASNVCTNNIMGGTSIQSSFSPMQIGLMHRTIRTRKDRPHIIEYPSRIESYQNIQILPGTSQTWTDNRTIIQDIIVHPYSCLTIKGQLEMGPNTKIIVKRLARLFVDGGQIIGAASNNSCPNLPRRWAGIEVWGNQDIPHPSIAAIADTFDNYIGESFSSGTGEVSGIVMLNNATIADAWDGITTKKRDNDDLDYSGGIIYAENTLFRNNRRAVEMLQYPRPNASIQQTNISRFINCDFVTDQVPTAQSVNESLFTLWDVHDVLFQNCTFRASMGGGSVLGSDENELEYGIKSIDAEYTVENCHFFNLARGIEASSINPDATINITGANDPANPNFYQCSEAIVANGLHQLNINNCRFMDFRAFPNYIRCGIYLHNVQRYAIEDNYLEDFDKGIATIQTGNTPGQLYHNIFRHGGEAINIQGDNRKLEVRCNDMNENQADIGLYNFGYNNGHIPHQGGNIPQDPDINPASNKFSEESLIHNLNDKNLRIGGNTVHFNYYCHETLAELRYDPIYDGGTDKYTKIYVNSDFNPICFPEDEDFFPDDEDDDGDGGGGGGFIPACRAINWQVCIDDAFDDIHHWTSQIDHNNTWGLLTAIQTAPRAAQTRRALQLASPYLSDTVLTAIILQNQMPFGWRKQFLVANAPFRPQVWQLAVEHLPYRLINILESVIEDKTVSERTLLELKIEQAKYRRSLLFAQIIETVVDKGTLSKEGRLASRALAHMIDLYIDNPFDDPHELTEVKFVQQQWIQLLIAQKQWLKAKKAIQGLSADDLDNYYFKQFAQISLTLAQKQLPWTAMTSIERQSLMDIAMTKTTVAAKARAVLSLTDGLRYPLFLPDESLLDVGKKSNTPYSIQEEAASLWAISPNPASQTIRISLLSNEPLAHPAQLVIYDITGKQLLQESITQEQLLLDIQELPQGLFICQFFIDHKMVQTSKLIVTK